MRLLDTWTGQFVEKDPRDLKTKYAILSHTWDSEGEQTYQELRTIQGRYASKVQRQKGPHAAGSDPSPSAERDHGPSSPTPSSSPPDGDALPTILPHGQEKSSSALSASHAPSSTAPAVSSPPDAPKDHPAMYLSPLWDDPELSPKIREACKVARENGHRYLWIDSCCIDKTSSSELSEAINSMYQWYSCAEVCFAFIADVPAEEDHGKEDSKFRKSRWFTRGWTLQELIAPHNVQFFSMKWTFIGSKYSLGYLISEITNIDENALLHLKSLREFSVAQRLSWAAKRETTRLEDRAYSLLGIFDINMPTLYGEGSRAFRRLQEEIMRRIPDQTLFAWTWFPPVSPIDHYQPTIVHKYLDLDHQTPLFAPSLDLFSECGGITPVTRDEVVRRLRLRYRLHLPVADYYFTPHGIRTQFPIIQLTTYIPVEVNDLLGRVSKGAFLVILQCEHKDHPGHLLGRVSYTRLSSHDVEILYSGYIEHFSDDNRYHSDLFPLSPERFKRLRWLPRPIAIKTFYIPHADSSDDDALQDNRDTPHKMINLILQKKTRDALRAHGYTVDLRGPNHDHPTTHRLTLSTDTHTITIEYQHTLKEDNELFPGDGVRQHLTIETHWHVELSGTLLESKSGELPPTAQGGRGTLSWSDYLLWLYFPRGEKSQSFQLPASIAGTEELWLTNKFALASTDYYFLRVELTYENPDPAPVEKQSWTRKFKTRLGKLMACTQSS